MNLITNALGSVQESGTVKIDLAKSGEKPPAPYSLRNYSGRFVVRVPPDVHRMLSLQAAESGVSLNRLVSSKLS